MGQCCPPSSFTPTELANHICGVPEGLPPPRLAGYQRQYGRPATGGSYHLRLTSAAFVSANENAAELEFTGVGQEAVNVRRACGTTSPNTYRVDRACRSAILSSRTSRSRSTSRSPLNPWCDSTRPTPSPTPVAGRGWWCRLLQVGSVLVRLTFDTYDNSPCLHRHDHQHRPAPCRSPDDNLSARRAGDHSLWAPPLAPIPAGVTRAEGASLAECSTMGLGMVLVGGLALLAAGVDRLRRGRTVCRPSGLLTVAGALITVALAVGDRELVASLRLTHSPDLTWVIGQDL